MDRLNTGIGIARRVSLAISEAGFDVLSVSQAADMTTDQMNDRLSGRVEFDLVELVRVGGFLHVPVSQFMKEAA
ncbi:hypothetical protein A4X17_11455 [Plantibacter sp. H53]|uniref:hypothetical protein n=1 Tax=Plantibacter sp. H53 TaxID=1827323 RepID=UPI0007D97AAF|nr:hypothetical protein [Plantibacter sp. H53]OAN35091.1 hypothetical protein A4X17_11455 [Plantibacter sp. H53]